MDGPVLELTDATVRYARDVPPSLDGASLAVMPGSCVALVGPNGAGKTTALRALLGLVSLDRGEARILGRRVREWPRNELARTVGVVVQREEPAFPITVLETVAMGRYARVGRWRPFARADHEAVERALAAADVARLRTRLVQTLSGGEWQRVRVARALAQEPRALVLDEPTASLDLRHEMELFELVAGLVRERGLAALVVSHHLNVAARFADRLVLVHGGRVVADDVPEKVLEPTRLAEVFGWPVAVHRLPDGSVQLYPERRPVKPGVS
jgi:iron complex transport system ATP-binding protein